MRVVAVAGGNRGCAVRDRSARVRRALHGVLSHILKQNLHSINRIFESVVSLLHLIRELYNIKREYLLIQSLLFKHTYCSNLKYISSS